VKPARPQLTREESRKLHKRENLRPALHVTLVFGGIVALQWAAIQNPTPWMYALCFVLMGGLQHHLSIVQHEANHWLLFANRTLNEIIGALASYSIGFTMAYRHQHFEHHRRLGEETDPDLVNYRRYPGTRSYAVWDLFLHLSGIAAAKQFLAQESRQKGSVIDTLLMALTQAFILGLFWRAGHWENYFILWILPLMTITKTLAHFRNVAEHIQLRDNGDPELSRYRTIRCGLIEKFFFAPLNFNYHAEHHFYPQIPYYHLPEVHALLSNKSEYASAVQIAPTYLGILLKKTIAP